MAKIPDTFFSFENNFHLKRKKKYIATAMMRGVLMRILGFIIGTEYLISNHCIVHRLNLAPLKVEYAFQKLTAYLSNYINFYQNSCKILKYLKNVARVLRILF